MKPFGALVHQRAGTVRRDIVRWLLPSAVPAAFGGVFLLGTLGDGDVLQQRVEYVVGTALMVAVAGMLVRLWLDRRRSAADVEDAHVPVRPVATLLIGVVGGLVVGMTSVGSGSLIIVMLMPAQPHLKADHLVGTDLVQAIPMVSAAALGHLLVGDADLGLAATLLIGAIPRVVLGALVSGRVSGPAVRWALVVLLTGSGPAMLRASSTVAVLACLAMAALGAFATVRGRTPARTTSTTEEPRAEEPQSEQAAV
ncbi:sulfite exporter TauE/SafE family protein [Streptomyces sp. NPDC054833]